MDYIFMIVVNAVDDILFTFSYKEKNCRCLQVIVGVRIIIYFFFFNWFLSSSFFYSKTEKKKSKTISSNLLNFKTSLSHNIWISISDSFNCFISIFIRFFHIIILFVVLGNFNEMIVWDRLLLLYVPHFNGIYNFLLILSLFCIAEFRTWAIDNGFMRGT